MSEPSFIEKQEDNLSIHIFEVSAAMVGVCLTVIGIISLITTLKKMQTLADEITALDAIIFLAACIISYTAIKTRERSQRLRFERVADAVFLAGLGGMVVICLFIVINL
jgi:branched-subunit amino acid permease